MGRGLVTPPPSHRPCAGCGFENTAARAACFSCDAPRPAPAPYRATPLAEAYELVTTYVVDTDAATLGVLPVDTADGFSLEYGLQLRSHTVGTLAHDFARPLSGPAWGV